MAATRYRNRLLRKITKRARDLLRKPRLADFNPEEQDAISKYALWYPKSGSGRLFFMVTDAAREVVDQNKNQGFDTKCQKKSIYFLEKS
jgi:hypothetical protein